VPPADHPPGASGHLAAQINEVAATTRDDPELDTLLLRLDTETACRRTASLYGFTDPDVDWLPDVHRWV
jgi:hypothetical protein